MSDVQQESTTERSALQAGIDWVAKHWPRVRLAHEGLMVDHVERTQRCVEVVARNSMTGQMDDMKGWPGNEEGDKMGVDIGDNITHNHYYAKGGTKPGEPGKARRTASTLAKVAFVAALLGTGAAVSLAIPWVMEKLHPPTVETPAATDTDTTRRVDVEVWRPE